MKDFKTSDGTLKSTVSSEVERIHRLRLVKAAVLDIVWAYLYSGREEEAWHNLMEMWPVSDVDRIRAAIQKSRGNGLRTQLDGLSTKPLPQVRNQVKVFASTTYSTVGRSQPTDVPHRFSVDEEASSPEVTPPTPILIRRLSIVEGSAQSLPMGDLTLTVVIDSAGKVVSAQPMGSVEWFNSDLMSALFEWKFVPAFHGKHPVASTMVKIISPQQ